MTSVIRKNSIQALRNEYRIAKTEIIIEDVNEKIRQDIIWKCLDSTIFPLIERETSKPVFIDWSHVKDVIVLIERGGWSVHVVGYIDGIKVTTNDPLIFKKMDLSGPISHRPKLLISQGIS